MKTKIKLNIPPVRRTAAATALSAAALLTLSLPYSAFAQTDTAVPKATNGITLSFHNADAADVLRAFALHSGVSVATSPSVKGRLISVRLRNVSVEEALKLITQAAGVSYRKTDGAYIVGTAEELKKTPEKPSSSTYALKNLAPAAAKSLIEGALPETSVQIAPGATAILISGAEQNVRQAQRLLEFADLPVTPTSEVMTPKHIKADFLADIVRRTLPGVTVEVKENTVIATGPQESLVRLKALVPAVDTEAGAVQKQRVEVYRIRFSSAAALASMLTSAIPGLQATPSAEPYAPPPARFQPLTSSTFGGTSAGGAGIAGGGAGGMLVGGGGLAAGGLSSGAPGGVNVSVIKSRQLILMGTEETVEQGLRLLRAVDVAPAQVAIEARIMDVSTDNSLDFGVQWGGTQTQNATGGGGNGTTQETFIQGSTLNKVQELNVPDMIRFGRFRRNPFDFAAQLQFLESRGRGKTLANPRISTLDNEDANIFIGDILRFQILAVSSPNTGNAFTVQEVPVGIALLVRPRVNEDGDITIKIHPVVSTLTNLVNGLPQTASREADTTLRVRDGETIAIGGLIRDQDIQTVQQVPILGNIPLFGELFKNRSRRKQRSEVVIFLTIKLLPEGGESAPSASPAGTAGTPFALPSGQSQPEGDH